MKLRLPFAPGVNEEGKRETVRVLRGHFTKLTVRRDGRDGPNYFRLSGKPDDLRAAVLELAQSREREANQRVTNMLGPSALDGLEG